MGDPGASKFDDILGHVKVTSAQFHPNNFDGELALVEGGRGFHPTLKVKVMVLSSHSQSIPSAAPAAPHRHEDELRELHQTPHFSQAEIAWYIRTFEALGDADHL